MPEQLHKQYVRLKKLASGAGLAEGSVSSLIAEMSLQARRMLMGVDRVELLSRVAGKQYFSFLGTEQSRPVNHALYVNDDTQFSNLLGVFTGGFQHADAEDIVRATYTIAYEVFAANDVYEVGRKASATFFEILIGHIISRAVGVSPRKKVRMPESGAELPTDYVFDPGEAKRKIHLPIKTSTRERAVQAWVHQLMLDRIFGNGAYRGVLVIAAETKRDTRSGEVIEICIPQQLQMFQSRVAEISRIYYLDPPEAYLALNNAFPHLDVRSFGVAPTDVLTLLGP